MNLLFLSMTFPDQAHRARGSYNLALCRELAKEHDVRVCSPRPWPEVLRERAQGRSITPGPDVEAAGLEAVYPSYWYAPWLTRNQSGRLLWESSRKAVAALAAKAPPDVVLSYWAHPDGEAGLNAARRHRATSAVIVGGTDALILPYRRGRGPHVRRVLTESDVVFTVSSGLRDAVINLGASPGKVHVMYQGVQPEIFHPGSQAEARARLGLSGSRPVLVWVGRMVGLKRLDVLLQACANLRQRNFNFELCLVGGGESRGQTERLVAQLGLGNHVRFVGSVPYHQTADWYRAADATVLCSDSEGLPNVLRESLACGTPFVATDVGSIREIASSGMSVLTPAGDAAALAESIQRVLEPRYRKAAQTYEARTWADCAADVIGVLTAARGRPSPPVPRREEVGV